MRYVTLLLASLFLCSSVYAGVDSVSGTTITGSSFGTKSPAKPWLYTSFDSDLTPDGTLGIIDSWTATENIEWDSDEGTNNSGCAKAIADTDGWTAYVSTAGSAPVWNSANQKCYVYRKIKRNFDIADWHNPGELNWKEFRVWSEGAGDGCDLYYATNNGGIMTEGVNLPSGFPYGDEDIMQGAQDVYNIKEFWFQANSLSENLTTSNGDGFFHLDVNGVEGAEIPYNPYGDETVRYFKMRQEGSAEMTKFYAIHGVNASATFTSGELYWVDDLYVDTTWARVMACNASTMAASTHREIQIPSAWSDTSITVTYNQGTFSDYETSYIIVIDSDGSEVGSTEGYFLDGTFYAAGEGPVATASSISGAYSISGACSIS